MFPFFCAVVLWKTCGVFLPGIPLPSSDRDVTWPNSSTVAGMLSPDHVYSKASLASDFRGFHCMYFVVTELWLYNITRGCLWIAFDSDSISSLRLCWCLLVFRTCNLAYPWRVEGMSKKWKTPWTSKVHI